MSSPIHLNIPEPCHESWQQMTPNEQGRHCMSCQKTVIDFSLMSDQEILHYISRASSSVCGRFNNDQLNKTYAEKKIKPAFTFRYVWNMLVATFLLTGSAATAQIKKKAKKKTIYERTWQIKDNDVQVYTTLGFVTSAPQQAGDRYIEPRLKIFGLIRDNITQQPVNAASVHLKGVKAGIEAGGDGRFEFPIVDLNGKVILEVTAKGYVTQEYLVDVNSFRTMEFFLDRDGSLLPGEDDFGVVIGKVVKNTMGEVVIKEAEQKQPTPTPATPPETERIILGTFVIIKLDDSKPAGVGNAAHKLEIVTKERKSHAVMLQPAADSLKPVEVIGFPPISCTIETPDPPIQEDELPVSTDSLSLIMTGGISVKHEVTVAEKVKREVKEWLPTKKDVRVYPNPVMPGNTVNINLNLEKAGEYKLDLMDASGKLVYVQALQVAQKNQVVNIPTQSSWSRGVYWVRISNATSKKVYQAKMLLQ